MFDATGIIPDDGVLKSSGTKQAKRTAKPGKRDGEYFINAVEKYFKFRQKFEGFWLAVEDGYRRTEFEAKGSLQEQLKQIYPGRIYRIVHTTESQHFSNNAKFYLEGYSPRLGGDVPPMLEDLTNSDWKAEGSVTKEVRTILRDASKYGLGISWTSYECDFEEERAEDNRPKRRKDLIRNPMKESMVSELETKIGVGMMSVPDEMSGVSYETDARMLHERIVTRRLSPWHLLIDPEAGSPETVSWIGRVIYADLIAVKEYEFFTHTKDLQATPKKRYYQKIGRSSNDSPNLNDEEADDEKIMLYEIFSRNRDGTWTLKVMDSESGTIIREVDNPYWCQHPANVLGWNYDGDCIFPQSDILTVYTEILAERLMGTKALDGYARQQEDVTYYDSESISPKEMYGHTDPTVGRLVPVKMGPNKQDIRTIVYKVPNEATSPEALNYLAFIERTIGMTMGFSPNQFGQALKSGTTATEASGIAQYATVSTAHKAAAVEMFLAEVATKRLAMSAQFYDVETIAKILGPEAAGIWAKINWVEADVRSGLRICVHPGSARAVSDDVRAQRLATAIQMSAQNPTAQAILNQMTLWKQFFKAIGLDMNAPLFNSDDPAELAQMQQMAMQQMQQQGGSAPAAGGMPSSEAGMAQMEQG
jgi:hypothetical protein